MPKKQGFLLLEIMIAFSLLCIGIVMITTVIGSVIRTRATIKQHTTLLEQIHTLFTNMHVGQMANHQGLSYVVDGAISWQTCILPPLCATSSGALYTTKRVVGVCAKAPGHDGTQVICCTTRFVSGV